MSRRPRCTDPKCPCVEHWQPPKTARIEAVGVPPLPARLEGFVVGRVTTEGTTEAYFLAYEGLRLVARPLPDAPPESWLPAVKRVEEFLGAVAAR